MNKNSKAITFIVIGIVAIVLSALLFVMKVGAPSELQYSPTNKYEVIPSGSVDAANNIYALTQIVKFGLGSILLVAGLVLIFSGIGNIKINKKENE